RGEARASAIVDTGGRATFVEGDASDRSSLEQARGEVHASLGVCDVLVNAAGGNDTRASVNESQRFEDIPLEAWNQVIGSNLAAGALLPTQVFAPTMIGLGRGSVINIASVAAHVPVSGGVTYSAAKAAVLNLTQFLSREWAKSGVRVNSITPGFFPADQNSRLLFHDDGSLTDRGTTIINATPAGRFGSPDELIGAAVFLASHAASGFVTGIDLRVDGGFLASTI
ncbi:MAG: SDR family oxidoreductase, partial [Planctomycetota bacterium]